MIQNKMRGCLLGGAIGDALGYQIEFQHGIREKQVTRFKDNFGIISDDTQMTLFTANALLWRETRLNHRGIAMCPSDAVYYGYLDWYDTQKGKGENGMISLIKEVWLATQNGEKDREQISWIKGIPELHCRRAPGNTCLSALHSGKMGTLDKPINNSKGCGGVMRIAPCGVITNNPHSAGKLAAECAAITHGHPLSSISSYACAAIISLLVYQDKAIEDAVLESLKFVKENQDIFQAKSHRPIEEHMHVFESLIKKAITLSKQDISDQEAIRQLGMGWVAEETLAIAIYACLRYPNSFEDAIICAVNHDGDSDSTGAVAGNIMGAALGEKAIPKYYIDNVELKNVVLEIADDLYLAASDASIMSTESWIRKYIDCAYRIMQ